MKSILFSAALSIAVIFGLTNTASAEGSVVVYNATNPKLATKIIEAFGKVHPDVSVDVISAGVGELLNRIIAESSNARGDVLMGASVEAYDSALDKFEPYTTTEDKNFDRSVVAENNEYYGFSMPLQAFIINRKLLPAGAGPKSWKDLGQAKFKGQIIMANPSLSGSAYAQLAQMLQLYDWDLIEKVIDNTIFVTSSKLVYQNVAKGENAIGITGDYNIVKMRSQGYDVDAIYPSEGTGLRFDANAIIKDGPNPDNARLFVDFLNSQQAHEIMVSLRSRRSVRKDVSAPSGQIPTADVPTFAYDPKKAASERTATLLKFDEMLSNK